jgi:UDP-N-acetyl-D-glucosamine dehydrogenase
MELLKERGARVDYYDPYIPVIGPTREHAEWTGVRSVKWSKKTIGSYDAVLISTAHKAVSYRQLATWARLIVDSRNAMSQIRTRAGQVWKALPVCWFQLSAFIPQPLICQFLLSAFQVSAFVWLTSDL